MVSTFTPNIQLEEPARGDDVGTWDTPVNSNMTVIDLIAGGLQTITLSNSNLTLSIGQYQCADIVFNGALGANVAVTFPTTFRKPYTVQNLCTGTGTYTIQLTTGAGQVVACPPGQPFDIINDGTNIKFKNFGPLVGGYWDYAGSAVPNWIGACTVPPFLNCDGSTFASSTYPALAAILGGTTLPDMRGRGRMYLNQGTARLTSSQGGLDGNTLFSAGGTQTVTLSSNHLPLLVDPGHAHSVTGPFQNRQSLSPGGFSAPDNFNSNTITTASAGTGITYGSSSPTFFSVIAPTVVGGLTLIRAA